jgi:phosphocarrier protein HPr
MNARGGMCRAVELVNQRGLHARASAAFIREAMKFDAHVTVHFDGQSVGVASIMDLLMLGARFGQTIEIETSGRECEPALFALVNLVERRFDEEI